MNAIKQVHVIKCASIHRVLLCVIVATDIHWMAMEKRATVIKLNNGLSYNTHTNLRLPLSLHFQHGYNARPFPSSWLPPLQSKSKCEIFMMVVSFTLHINEN